MRILQLFLFICYLFVNIVKADLPAIPFPMVTASNHGITYFTMLPEKNNYKSGIGVAYKLEETGKSKELWHVNGWYAFQVYLSNNGDYLVRMGNWPQGMEPSSDDLAVSFYKKGIMLKSYSTADLIKNKTSVKRTVSHYIWQASDNNYPNLNYSNEFVLKTIEGVEYMLDITSGNIINKTPNK
jgi:hypothetical protein